MTAEPASGDLPEPIRGRVVTDRALAGVAIAAALGAYAGVDVPPEAALALSALLSRRTRWFLPLGALVIAVMTSGLAARSEHARTAPLPDHVSGVGTVVSDAERLGAALRFEVSVDGRRFEVWARGAVARSAEELRVGNRLRLRGPTQEIAGTAEKYLSARHVAGRVQAERVEVIGAGRWPFRVANAIRDRIARSGDDLSRRDQILLAGFVYGDDRGQLPEVVDDLRATGLTHLLAVSGQNVAYVLLVLGPLLRRLSMLLQMVVLAGVLAEFVVVTRAEPSVLRACLLALAAVGARSVGRPVSSQRLLAVVVTVLLLVDPMLVHSVGFQLSVTASVGIGMWAERIERVLVGPGFVRTPLAVTCAAQAGVLPVQILTFGSFPLVSIPANLVAGAASGPAMIWGFVAGMISGGRGGNLAMILHLPTRVFVGWVAGAARVGASVGGPVLDRRTAVLGLLVGLFVRAVSKDNRVRVAAISLALIVVANFSLSVSLDVRGAEHIVVGDLDVVVVDRPSPERLLGGLRSAGVDSIDLVVARSSSAAGREAVRALISRHDVTELWTPPGFDGASSGLVGGGLPLHVVIRRPRTVRGGALTVEPVGTRLDATVGDVATSANTVPSER